MNEPRPRRRWGRKLAYAAGAAFIVGGTVVALGPAAPWIVDNMGDGQRVWRLGHLQLDGVSGSWLGNLRAETLTLADEQGVWIKAHDVVLDWSPFAIISGTVDLDSVRAGSINLLRQPTLLERRPSSGADFNIDIASLEIGRIDVQEAAFGQAAQFSASAALNLHGADVRLIDATAQRIDSDADHLRILYRPDGDYVLDAEIRSAPGGILARALGLAEHGFSATATGNGDTQTGEARYLAAIGDEQILSGAASWTPATWRAEGNAQLDRIPGLTDITRRLGAAAHFNATGERVGAFEAHAETSFLALDISGTLNEERELQGSANVVARTNRLSDIARESPFELGAARFEGELRRARGTLALRGALQGQGIEALGQTVALAGPVEAVLTDEAFNLTGDLRAPQNSPALFANARLRTNLSYNRAQHRFALDAATLESDALALNARGWSRPGTEGEFSGDWRVRQLQAISADLRGGASGAWRAFGDAQPNARVWTITVAGTGANIAGEPNIIPQLLGGAPDLDAMLRIENGGITVSHARVNGARLRAGATGRIVSGEANLALEASARGPLTIGGAEMDGAIDATGRLTGRISRPTLTADAAMSSFTASGVVVTQPHVRFTLAPNGRAYAGRADVQGQVSGQAATASANVSVANSAITLTNLDAQVAALAAQGSATIAPSGVSAELDINGRLDGLMAGLSGGVAGDVSLTPRLLRVNAAISDARAGDLRVRAATVQANGPLDAIAATFNMRGRLREAPLAFEGVAQLDIPDSTARIEGRGELAEAPVFTRAPITLHWNGGLQTALNVGVGDGVVQAQWQDRRRGLSGSAQIEDAPIAPLAAIWGERATGRIDGRISLANRGGGLAGEADLLLDDARFAGRQRGTLDMRVLATLEPNRLRANVDARSTEGLEARIAADAPVVTDANPIRIALAPERRGEATWTVHGPAASLWAAARLPDQSLEGQLDGEGRLQFGAGYLSGAGHLEIVDGRFEDKLTGITLVDLDARVGIGDNGVRIEQFSAAGPRGGRITATGGSDNPRRGTITVTLDEMRVADRPDAQAVASGALTLAWEGLDAELTGNLNLIEASVDIAGSPEAGIPTLDVIEINRPGYEDEEEEEDEPLRHSRTTLDVRVTAPGRVFTRGRGVDAEWSLDLRLQGSANNPQVIGRARAVRGTIALSGQPFEIDDALIIFSGDPLDARIDLTATRSTADLTAYLRLTGTARAPEISFTSDPALPEDEILPQILFGRSVEDLSGFEAAQLASSLAALSGRSSLDLIDAARAATGLDRFAVRQDEAGGFLVAGGVYLTRDVYVEIGRTGLGQAQTQVEWTIRPRLVLITSFLGNGDQRVSLRWRRESD